MSVMLCHGSFSMVFCLHVECFVLGEKDKRKTREREKSFGVLGGLSNFV